MPFDLPGPDASGHRQGVLDGEGVVVDAGHLHGQQPAGVCFGGSSRTVRPISPSSVTGGGPPLEVLGELGRRLGRGRKRAAVQARQHRFGDIGAGAGDAESWPGRPAGRRRPGTRCRPRRPAPTGTPPRPGHGRLEDRHRAPASGRSTGGSRLASTSGRGPPDPVAPAPWLSDRRHGRCARRVGTMRPWATSSVAQTAISPSQRRLGATPSASCPLPTPTSQPSVWSIGAHRALARLPPGMATSPMACHSMVSAPAPVSRASTSSTEGGHAAGPPAHTTTRPDDQEPWSSAGWGVSRAAGWASPSLRRDPRRHDRAVEGRRRAARARRSGHRGPGRALPR